ncbi:MAG: hypothetical protein K2G49_03160 [Muribaculum sp.]|nr:hypothetical protein [Muribaculum sp.]
MRVFRATSQSPLQLRGGALRLFTGCYWRYIQLRGGALRLVTRVLLVAVYTCSVGASGSSPALRPACPQCVYFGRPSSRPYSYAVERCGDYQVVIGGIYRHCRGEWELARVASGVSAMRVFRATFQSPLQLRGEASRWFTGRYVPVAMRRI